MPDQQSGMLNQAFWLPSPRPGSEMAMVDAALAALDAAAALAHAGDRQHARELCAAVVFETQPVIAAHAELLRAAFYVLLMAHGFKLLSRLVLAISGRSVQVVMLPRTAGPIAPPQHREEQGCTIYLLDPRWLGRLSPDDMSLQRWCNAVVGRRDSPADLPAMTPAPRHLEPV